MRCLSLAIAGALLLASCHAATLLNAKFEDNRVYVMLLTASGRVLSLYTDTGGGSVLGAASVARLGITTKSMNDARNKVEGGSKIKITRFPSLAPGEPDLSPASREVMVVPEVRQVPHWPAQGDGILGQDWFGSHVWTWDYPGKKLMLDDSGIVAPRGSHLVALGFKTDRGGRRDNNFPRIVVEIDGSQIPLLLDTGAESYLTPEALRLLADGGPRFRATSMIVASLFDAWHAKHPGWRVIRDAQTTTHAAMIEVPQVTIAGFAVGPVWFTERPDANFHKFMSSLMSERVDGSLGGNALSHFEMTVDYPRATAWFVCTNGCRMH